MRKKIKKKLSPYSLILILLSLQDFSSREMSYSPIPLIHFLLFFFLFLFYSPQIFIFINLSIILSPLPIFLQLSQIFLLKLLAILPIQQLFHVLPWQLPSPEISFFCHIYLFLPSHFHIYSSFKFFQYFSYIS